MKRLLREWGYAVVQIDAAPEAISPGPLGENTLIARMQLQGILTRLKRLGAVPVTIVDVGAAYGDFTRLCACLFPGVRIVMFEPLVEYKPHLDRVTAEYPAVTLRLSAAASAPGVRVINVHPDFVGSSLFLESEEQSDVNGVPREIVVTTVDLERAALALKAPMLMKVDVQGAELEVLAGAEATLRDCEAVILETTLFSTFAGGPLIHEAVEFMVNRGFRVYDLCGHLYRPLDGALFQVDLVFVPEQSALRQRHAYATPEQRVEQTERFAARLGPA